MRRRTTTKPVRRCRDGGEGFRGVGVCWLAKMSVCVRESERDVEGGGLGLAKQSPDSRVGVGEGVRSIRGPVWRVRLWGIITISDGHPDMNGMLLFIYLFVWVCGVFWGFCACTAFLICFVISGATARWVKIPRLACFCSLLLQ